MKNIINSKNINIFLSVFILIFLFLLIRMYCACNYLQMDDCNSTLAGFGNIFNSKYHNYFDTFIDILLGWYIPLKLGVHPSFYKYFYYSYIQAFAFLSFIFVFSLVLYRKIDKIFPLAIFTAFGIFLYSNSWQIYFNLAVYTNLSRWIMPALYWTLLFYLLTLNNFNSKKFYIISIYILSLLCSISNELICITTLVGLFIYNFVQAKENSNNVILKCSVISLFGFIFLVFSGMFTRYTDVNSINIQYFLEIIKIIPDFIRSYIKYVFINHFFEYIIIAFQIYIICKKNIATDKNKNIIKLSLCFIFAYLFFMFLLILFGIDYIVITKGDLHFCISVINCVCNMTLFNILLTSNIVKKQFIYTILVLVPLLLILFLKNNYIETRQIIMQKRVETYKAEKIIRLANEKNKNAYLDEAISTDAALWHLFNVNEETGVGIKYIDTLNLFEKGKKIDCNVIFTDPKIVEEEFAKNGGVFTKEELEHPNFNNLLNKDFIQNKL